MAKIKSLFLEDCEAFCPRLHTKVYLGSIALKGRVFTREFCPLGRNFARLESVIYAIPVTTADAFTQSPQKASAFSISYSAEIPSNNGVLR